jgi:general secretion pathway protein K
MTRTARLIDLARRLRARLRRRAGRQAGVALVIAMVAVVVLTAIASEFAYNTRVEMQMAANAENELRAHYFAESAVQLGQAAMIIQQMIDRFGDQFGGLGGMTSMIKIDELIDLLLPMFNLKEGGGMLGSLLGIDPGAIKGLGVEGGTFDLKVGFEDGKLNLNCAGGLDQATDTPQKKALGTVLLALFSAERYRPLFERPNSEGLRVTAAELATGLVDWVDVDEALFMSGGGAEDYQYDNRRDKYTARNYFVDTPQELRMVRGMGDDQWASFGDYLTAYGPCAINLSAVNPDHWPLIEAIIRAFAEPADPVAHDERKLEALAQYVTPMVSFAGSSTTTATGSGGAGGGAAQPAAGGGAGGVVDQFVQMVGNPTQGASTMSENAAGSQVQVEGVKLRTTIPELGVNLGSVIRGGKKTVFRLEASGESGPGCSDPKRGHCSRRKITAIFNSNKMGINALQAKSGVWTYWREE